MNKERKAIAEYANRVARDGFFKMLAVVVGLTAILCWCCLKAPAQDAVRWSADCSGCDSTMVDGAEVRSISRGGLTVSAVLIKRRRWIPHAFVTVENASNERVTVDPANWLLHIDGEKGKDLHTKEPDALARSLDRRGALAGALSSFGGSMATKETTGTVHNSDGSTSTVILTEKDQAAQARADVTGQQQRETLAGAAQYVRERSLRANTVQPGDTVYGIVWFENKGYKQAMLVVNIAGTVFEFPLEPVKK